MNVPPPLKNFPLVSQWLSFASDGGVDLLSGRVELGQGIATALTQIAVKIPPNALFASFAAGAFRAATEAATVVVHVSDPDGDGAYLRNPDFTRLSVQPQETEEDATLVLHNLSDSFLTSLRLGDAGLPTLSIGADGDNYLMTFDFGSDHLEDAQAIAFVSGLARRLADPLHHLV